MIMQLMQLTSNSYSQTLGVAAVFGFKLVVSVLMAVVLEGTAVDLIVVPKNNFNTKDLNIAQDC